ncbi:MAG: phosphatidylglycerol lysyltransferase domain-containing protein [Bacteroidales bacterium]|jgi:hypothetical protein|nr:phosphatidylglycerol lysyltransferase domain-containing protein [Bacteroidales bacterium]
MLDFKAVKFNDKNEIEPFLQSSPYQICNFSFVNLIIWGDIFSPMYVIDNEMIVFLSQIEGQKYFNFPIGKGNVEPVLEKMMQYAKEQNIDFQMINITEEMKSTLETIFPSRFIFDYSDDYSDYLYKMEDLCYLKGKKYQPKRNHINNFKKNYNYSYNQLTINDIEECLEMHEVWQSEHCSRINYMLEKEFCATRKALLNLNALELKGGVLRIDNQVVAFTLGYKLNSNTFDVCIEKALSQYNGAYQVINQMFVSQQLTDFEYINREEDLGNEGLRKAKQSYYPYKMLKKYIAKLK